MLKANLLLGFYRKADCEDPEVYSTGVSALLTSYSSEVVSIVTDPRTGIASRCKWLPTIAEIREACDRESQRIGCALEQDRRIAEQFENAAERERVYQSQGPAERRREFIKREMAALELNLKRDEKSPDLDKLDVRGMEPGPQREIIRQKVEARLEEIIARNRSTPLTIGPDLAEQFAREERDGRR